MPESDTDLKMTPIFHPSNVIKCVHRWPSHWSPYIINGTQFIVLVLYEGNGP